MRSFNVRSEVVNSTHPANYFHAIRHAKLLVVLAGLLLPIGLRAQLNYFPVATNAIAMGMAFDGSNCLVGIENHATVPTSIGAQMLGPHGDKVGSLLLTGRTGISTSVAFDGTNYLVIWEDDGIGTLNGNTGWQVYGQFISKAGALVGAPFPITTTGIWFDGMKTMAFGKGKYLVTYTRLIDPALGSDSNNRYIAGRIVSPDGTMGSELRISTGFGKSSDVAFDGNNFFVVWCEDWPYAAIRGRFVSPTGEAGTEIPVNASAAASDNPKSVIFDGANYLVVWNDEVGGFETGEWDPFAQFVSTNGSLVGGVIPLASEPGEQLAIGVAFDGINYFAVWVDMQNGTNWDAYGQFFGRNGALLGAKTPVCTAPGNQMVSVGFVGNKYVLGVANGVIMGEGGVQQVSDSVGAMLPPLPRPQMVCGDGSFGVRTNRFGFNISGTSGQEVVVEACASLANPVWQPVRTNTLTTNSCYFSDATWTNSAGRFYRLRLN